MQLLLRAVFPSGRLRAALTGKSIMMVGASLAAAVAMERTGGAHFIAESVVGAMDGQQPAVILSALFLVTAVLTNCPVEQCDCRVVHTDSHRHRAATQRTIGTFHRLHHLRSQLLFRYTGWLSDKPVGFRSGAVIVLATILEPAFRLSFCCGLRFQSSHPSTMISK